MSRTVDDGQEFNINVSIDPVNNPVTAAQFNLIFNSTYLEIKNITEGNVFKQNGADTIFNSGILNNSGGTLINVWGLIITPGANVTTKGAIAIITILAKTAGTSHLNLTHVIVSDPDSQAAVVNITNGSVNSVVPAPTPTPVQPTPTPNSTSAPIQPTSTSTQTTGSGGGGGSSSGGGGGAGGTSGEEYNNIELKEKYDLYIYKDIITSYTFSKPANPVRFINITGNTNAGEINTAVEVLRNTSSLVKTPSEDEIYKNINIWVGTFGFATPQNIKESVITFRVNKSWINENGIDPASISLMCYSDGWNALSIEKLGEDTDELYYEARINSFGHFAITGKKLDIYAYGMANPASADAPEPSLQHEDTPDGNHVAADEPGNPGNLTTFLWMGLLIGSITNAVLILKIRSLMWN